MMKALISFVAVCGILATTMVPNYQANAATRIDICRKKLMENGAASTDIMVHGGYCYDVGHCPNMTELFKIELPRSTRPNLPVGSHPATPEKLSKETEDAVAKASAAKEAACNACTSGGKPLCVSQ